MAPLVIDKLDSLSKYVGREIATSEWTQVSQAQIQQFADATGDHNWIHMDAERARRESPYGTTIAHGFLTLSLLSQLMSQSLRVQRGVRMTINYGLNRVRFPSPVRADSRIRSRITLQSVKNCGDCTEAVYSIVVEVADVEKPCCVAEWILRYYPEFGQ
jgi:acyl dehydratase